MARRAFGNADTFETVRSILFEENKIVGAIDHDLASKRSFSLAAKVTFQRQRNVERRIEEMKTEYTGSRIYSAMRKATSLFG